MQTAGFSVTAWFAIGQLVFLASLAIVLWVSRSPRWTGGILVGGLTVAAVVFTLGTAGTGLHVPFWMMTLPLLGLLLVGPRTAVAAFMSLMAASVISQRIVNPIPGELNVQALIPFQVLVVMVLIIGLSMAGWGYSTYIRRRLEQAKTLLARSRNTFGRVTPMQSGLQKNAYGNGSHTPRPSAKRDTRGSEFDHLKATLLANLNHEVRTPLTGILGYTAILEDVLDDHERELTRPIKLHASRLMETLNALLDLAQLEQNSQPLSLRPTDVVSCIEGMLPKIQARAQSKQLALNLRIHIPEAWALLDAEGFNAILFHLLSNAVKFTEQGYITLEAGADEASVYLRVSDTGTGIDPAFIPHLFEPFRQASTGETRRYGGNGIGLSIAQKTAKRLRGSLTVESDPGRGSTFTVRFPRIERPSDAFSRAA